KGVTASQYAELYGHIELFSYLRDFPLSPSKKSPSKKNLFDNSRLTIKDTDDDLLYLSEESANCETSLSGDYLDKEIKSDSEILLETHSDASDSSEEQNVGNLAFRQNNKNLLKHFENVNKRLFKFEQKSGKCNFYIKTAICGIFISIIFRFLIKFF
ncbi:hypothetical protein MHBO_002985, partial [Bonamia ostreae]